MNLRIALFCCSLMAASPAWSAAVKARTSTLEIPTYGWSAVPHPYLRATDKVNIYPYQMLDFLSREKTNRIYKTVVLENDYLKITFLPELGGKIHEVINKTTGKPMFYVNHVVKPGLIGQCGAWTSGGVEWNTGPQGHTVSCMVPVDIRILPAAQDGSVTVAVGETERIYGTKWTVLVTLRPDRSFIEERIRIYNPTDNVRPYYFWNCTASPNTPGFRFIYPMTLGCDHAGEKFFRWPFDHGKDLTRGTNYIDASSIFAWHCDQDFFGSYNDDLGYGVVACANHHQLPGKKAWTWGQGGFGKMHQMDLTDTDGPYNEVQTGPLLTQAQVGRLEPSEAVEWTEYWYPIHEIGGFTFANKDVAVNASTNGGMLKLQLLGTGSWDPVEARLVGARGAVSKASCAISPKRPSEISFQLSSGQAEVQLIYKGAALARFDVPLKIPDRQPPGPQPKPETASEIAQAGWEDYLFARYGEAELKFKKALEKDPAAELAQTGLALLRVSYDPPGAREQANAALKSNPDSGLANLILASASEEMDQKVALEHAWKATLDPATAVAGRAEVARLLLRNRQWEQALDALSGTGPWESDPTCRNRRAFAQLQLGNKKVAAALAHQNLDTDPLDTFALAILWLEKETKAADRLAALLSAQAVPVLELAAQFDDLQQQAVAFRIIQQFYLRQVQPEHREPLAWYWAQFLASADPEGLEAKDLGSPPQATPPALFPHRTQEVRVLRYATRKNPSDSLAQFFLGSVLLHLGRAEEARQAWNQAAKQGAPTVLALRALAMVAKNTDNDNAAARRYLEQAAQTNTADPIVARDLARILFEAADKAANDAEKSQLITQARDRLQSAFAAGKARSDFIGLLSRAQNCLGNYAETARILDSVRVTVWEGAREVHDLFEQAHLALGEAFLKQGRNDQALAEFNRALEYPENLATGKLENAREAHIHLLRGNALAAMGHGQEAVAAWQLAANEPESNNARQTEARQKAKEALQNAGR